MNRPWKFLYPECRYFDGNQELRRRVEKIIRSKKFGARPHVWARILFVGVPLVVIFVIIHYIVHVNPVFRPGVDQLLVTAAFFLICAILGYIDRNKARRNFRRALALCGVPICVRCGYDLANTDPSQLCPECGAPLSTWNPRADQGTTAGTHEP